MKINNFTYRKSIMIVSCADYERAKKSKIIYEWPSGYSNNLVPVPDKHVQEGSFHVMVRGHYIGCYKFSKNK